MKVLVTIPLGVVRDTFITPDVKEKIESLGQVVWNNNTGNLSPDRLRDALEGVDVCITGWGTQRFDEFVLEKADLLKLVAHTGGSVAPIVSDELYNRGIKVVSGNYLYAESVAECVVAYALSSLREISHYSGVVRAGGWKTANYYNEGLLDQSVGLVGFGMIAKHLVGMLKPFRNKIKVYAPDLTDELIRDYGIIPASLEEVFTTCKIISIHAPSIPETFHMIDKRLLGMIPAGSIFINTARGSVVDEQALIEELKTKRFKAALDVYEVEPLAPDSELRSLENVIAMPHMGGPTIDRRRYVTLGLLEDIERFLKGENLRYEIKKEYAVKMTGGK